MKSSKAAKAAAVRPDPEPLVVLVGDRVDWHSEIESVLAREGHATVRVGGLDAALQVTETRRVGAILVAARPLAASDVLLLRRVREQAPGTAVVAVTRTPTDPDLKSAFENGATAFLSWPASTEAVRHAIAPGTSRRSPN